MFTNSSYENCLGCFHFFHKINSSCTKDDTFPKGEEKSSTKIKSCPWRNQSMFSEENTKIKTYESL